MAPPRRLFSTPAQYLWCTTASNVLMVDWMRNNALSYKWFWASFVNMCIVIVEKQAHEGDLNKDEEAAMACLRRFHLDTDELIHIAAWYRDGKYQRGEILTGEIKIDGDPRDIIRGQEILRRKVFSEKEVRAQQEEMGGEVRPTYEERKALKKQWKMERRGQRAADTAAVAGLLGLGQQAVLDPLSSLGLALPAVSGVAMSRPRQEQQQQAREHGTMVVRVVEAEEEDAEVE